jgi:hybrid cluster-associated redox disulfide protein
MQTINENMLIGEILEMDEDTADVLIKHGLNCLGCPGSYSENLREAAEGHGIKLEKLIEDLNRHFNK